MASTRSASRRVGRLTSSRAASSRSGGSRSPGTSSARSTAARTCSTTSSNAAWVVTGRNIGLVAVNCSSPAWQRTPARPLRPPILEPFPRAVDFSLRANPQEADEHRRPVRKPTRNRDEPPAVLGRSSRARSQRERLLARGIGASGAAAGAVVRVDVVLPEQVAEPLDLGVEALVVVEHGGQLLEDDRLVLPGAARQVLEQLGHPLAHAR